MQNYENIHNQTNAKATAAPEVGAAGGWSGRSIFRFVDIYAADVVEAVAEFFEDEKMSAAAVESEDV